MTGERSTSGPHRDPHSGGATGQHPTVDHIVQRLIDVGDRERRLLTSESIDRIARAAARQRRPNPHLATTESPTTTSRPTDVVLLAGPGPLHRASRGGRRPVLALAAAILLAAVAGAALVSAPDQVVMTQEGASPGSVAPDPIDEGGVVEAPARPVLDLGESLATTTDPPPINTSDPAASRASSGSTLSTSSPGGPSTAAQPASTTSAPTISPQPSSSAPTVSNRGDEPDDERPATDRWLTIEIGDAATADLEIDDSQTTLGDLVTAEGWLHSVGRSTPATLEVDFERDANQASIRILSEPGRYVLDVDHGFARPSSRVWTRTFSIDRRGTVAISYGSHGLDGLDIELDGGLEHEVTTVGPDHLLIRILDEERIGRWDGRIRAGSTTIDVEIGS